MSENRSALTPSKSRNRRTALILLSVAAVFFFGIVLRRWLIGA